MERVDEAQLRLKHDMRTLWQMGARVERVNEEQLRLKLLVGGGQGNGILEWKGWMRSSCD